MSKKYQIKSCIICDVARKEFGGKDILIGVYSSSMTANEIPFTMAGFAVWLEIKPGKTAYNSVAIEVLNPDGTLLVGAKGDIKFSDAKEFTGLPFQFPTLTFPMKGIYKIKFGFDDAMEEVGEFKVQKGKPPKIS